MQCLDRASFGEMLVKSHGLIMAYPPIDLMLPGGSQKRLAALMYSSCVPDVTLSKAITEP